MDAIYVKYETSTGKILEWSTVPYEEALYDSSVYTILEHTGGQFFPADYEIDSGVVTLKSGETANRPLAITATTTYIGGPPPGE